MNEYQYTNWPNGASAAEVRSVLENSFKNLASNKIKERTLTIENGNWTEDKNKDYYYIDLTKRIENLQKIISIQSKAHFDFDLNDAKLYSDIPCSEIVKVVYL